MTVNEKIIHKAQVYLRNTGSKITVNGRYTIGMMTALMSFQRKHGLTATGELDIQTWKALKKENGFLKRLKRRFRK